MIYLACRGVDFPCGWALIAVLPTPEPGKAAEVHFYSRSNLMRISECPKCHKDLSRIAPDQFLSDLGRNWS